MKISLKVLAAIVVIILAVAISNMTEGKKANSTPKPKSNKDKNKSDVNIILSDVDDDAEEEEEEDDEKDKGDVTTKPKVKPSKKNAVINKKKPTKTGKTKENKKDVKGPKLAGPKGEKGDVGPAGPAGPPGPKGEAGESASASIPMQAAVSTVLTEHFGPAKDTILPFDLILLDLGDNYDNSTGVFICTIPGVYVVSLYLMSHPGAKVNARIYINSRPIAALWADDNKNVGFYPSSSIQTVTRLEFGDQVYVMLVDGGYGESWVHANYNAFTLYMLYEDSFMKK